MRQPKLPDQERSNTYKTGNVFAVRGTQEWKDWVDHVAAESGGLGISDLVNLALIDWAKNRKIKPTAPPRLN